MAWPTPSTNSSTHPTSPSSPSKNVSDSSSTPSTLLEKIADSPGDCAPPNCVTPPHSKTSTSKHPRRLNRQQIMTLSTCAWLTEQHNLIVSGPTGIGKSFIACALVERACRRGFNRLLHPRSQTHRPARCLSHRWLLSHNPRSARQVPFARHRRLAHRPAQGHRTTTSDGSHRRTR